MSPSAIESGMCSALSRLKEDICVLLKVKSTNGIDVVVPIGHDVFGRFGMYLEIKGMERGRTVAQPYYLRLLASESYTFFRVFTMGPSYKNILHAAYETPRPGRYEAKLFCDEENFIEFPGSCLLYTSPSPRD